MLVLAGECFLSQTGNLYRVIEANDDVISMIRANGFTILAFKSSSVPTLFQPCACFETEDSPTGYLPIKVS
jgi:hypothetical protein